MIPTAFTTTAASASPFLIETDGVFTGYSGPVGAAINGPPAHVDAGYGPSSFSDGGSTALSVQPQIAYPGYAWSEFADT